MQRLNAIRVYRRLVCTTQLVQHTPLTTTDAAVLLVNILYHFITTLSIPFFDFLYLQMTDWNPFFMSYMNEYVI